MLVKESSAALAMSWGWRKTVVWMLLVLAALTIIRARNVESCIEEERLALLDLNSYFRSHVESEYDVQYFVGIEDGEEDPNCCTWWRVHCNPTTQHVIKLDLFFPFLVFQKAWVFNVTMLQPFRQLISLDLSDNNVGGFTEKEGSPKLSTLKNLQSLALDLNDLENGQTFLSSLTSLKNLSLRGCGFNRLTFPFQELESLRELQVLDLGMNMDLGPRIFQSLCKLKNLSKFNLSYNYIDGVLPSCLHNLSSLQVVDLSYNQINGRFQDIVTSFNLESLRYLSVSNNNLTGEVLPNIFPNFTYLEHLDLSDNQFEGKLSLSSFANHSKLQHLDLSRNHLQVDSENSSWRPSFQLQHLGLQGCSLNEPDGIVPKFLSQQCSLSFINLSDNNLVGSFPSFLLSNTSMPRDFDLDNDNSDTQPSYSGHPLNTLKLSGNNFHGALPENIGFIYPQMKVLSVSGCHLEGTIPTSITHTSQLSTLDLSFNNFSGELPRQLLSDLTWLEELLLNDNHLEGEIIPDHMNLTWLISLKLSNNHFGGTIKYALRRSSQLVSLDISNNKVTGSLPSWIGSFYQLFGLYVSKNALQGQIPEGICKLKDLMSLDLSENNFTGSIHSCSDISLLSDMNLRHNKLTGAIPNALSSGSNLRALDLRDNQLSGGIPLWINKLQSLEVLQLGGNNLQGQIPQQLCQLRGINILDLSNNKLSGSMLTCFGNMSFGFKTITHTTISPGEEEWRNVGYRVEEVELLVKNLNLAYVGIDLEQMSALDLSSNKFSGFIPPELGDLKYVHSINLSHNCLSGSIPSNLSNLKQIESLDLSYNHMNGMIPIQLAELNFLGTFNVSYNNLTGRTPETGQFGNFDERSYFGNPGLCVTLVNTTCNPLPPNAPPRPVSSTSEEDGDDDGGGGLDMEDFLWSFGMTSFVAFMATIAVLGINPRWREALFDFTEWHLLWWLL